MYFRLFGLDYKALLANGYYHGPRRTSGRVHTSAAGQVPQLTAAIIISVKTAEEHRVRFVQ